MKQYCKLYYTSDTHGCLFSEQGSNAPSLSSAFAEYRKDGNTLVLDGGDTLQGAPLLRYLWQRNQCPEVLAEVMCHGNMDYYTLGNHDFNHGHAALSRYVNKMQGTCLAANVIDTTAQPMQTFPYAIHTLENGLRIGLVGIVTDYVNVWEAEENLQGLEITDAFAAAKEALEALNSVENKVDYTICIYHGGFERDITQPSPSLKATAAQGEGTQRSENVACKICSELNFDLLLTAHQHMEQPLCFLEGTAVLQLPPNVEKYAEIEICIATKDDAENMEKTRQREVSITANFITPIAAADAQFLQKMQPYRSAAGEWLQQKAGSLAKALPAEEDKIALATGTAPLAQLANYVQLQATGAEVSITSLPNQAVEMPKEVTIGDVLTVYPFANEVVCVAMQGNVLAQGIARSAAYFAKDQVGNLCVATEFVKPKQEHYNYDFFAGVSYTVHVCEDGDNEVSEILVNGEAIVPERNYRVVLSDYRATGTGGYPFYAECPRLPIHTPDIQTLVLETLAKHPHFSIPTLSKVVVG